MKRGHVYRAEMLMTLIVASATLSMVFMIVGSVA